jgi:hypothetical protein
MLAGLLLALAAGGLLAGCSGSGDGETGVDDGPAAADAPAVGAVAAAEFVSAAIEGADPEAYLVDDAAGSGQLEGRLSDLAAFDGTVARVEPSTTAYPDASEELGPACDDAGGTYCQVDLFDGDEELVASVAVYWFGDGVSDFAIVGRAPDGRATGIGEAHCGPGTALLHGGHSPDRFDVAVCVGEDGRIEYNGWERGTTSGIRLDGCQEAPDRWLATNEGYRYLVDGSGSPVMSALRVYDPSGENLLDETFAAVRLPAAGSPVSC